ncbi:hypothetical protein GCM10010365_29790 [Streptomyces poonensis]|uniref:Uncharacterized protein n=1 Tax=Streptomyces poonensis TaxID=68255 RepID=A0A918PGZ1_9ACTN|nr:hypothetical protein GCM10010365_29790 [Streptomyces poonensis]GLJ90532.1 hypothetical protein GCM10017589_31350 [Streptomyces poonensis]
MATLVLPAPAGPISSTASVAVVASGVLGAGGALGAVTGPPGGSCTCPVVSRDGGEDAWWGAVWCGGAWCGGA